MANRIPDSRWPAVGLRPFTRADLERLAAVATPPLKPAAIAWALTDQDRVGMGHDGKVWVLPMVGDVRTFAPAHALAALRLGWREWRAGKGTRPSPDWLFEWARVRVAEGGLGDDSTHAPAEGGPA